MKSLWLTFALIAFCLVIFGCRGQVTATARIETAVPLPTRAPATRLPTQAPTATQAAATSAAPTATVVAGSAGNFTRTFPVQGVPRVYHLHVPPAYHPDQPVALVLNFHGFGSNAKQEEALSGMSAKADAENFIVIYPEGSGNPQRWNFGPEPDGKADLEFVRDMLTQTSQDYSIDPARIYATGISNGAEMTDHLACEMADTFAAVASVAGGYLNAQPCNPTRPVPIVEFHGTADRLLPYQGQGNVLLPIPDALAQWAQRNACDATPTQVYQKGNVKGAQWGNCKNNADVVLYTVDGGGHSWPGSSVMPRAITTQDVNATDVMWDFFKAHPK